MVRGRGVFRTPSSGGFGARTGGGGGGGARKFPFPFSWRGALRGEGADEDAAEAASVPAALAALAALADTACAALAAADADALLGLALGTLPSFLRNASPTKARAATAQSATTTTTTTRDRGRVLSVADFADAARLASLSAGRATSE